LRSTAVFRLNVRPTPAIQSIAYTTHLTGMRSPVLILAMVAMLCGAGAPAYAAAPPPANTFRDCAECPEMVAIAAGRFVMGTAADEEERENLAAQFRHRSEPARSVTVRGFSVGKYEITRGQYRAFAEATGRDGGGCFVWNGTDFDLDREKSWRNTGYAQNDSHPVACVSWEDAIAYVRWLAQKTARAYRLLSEAEWEYAARAGTSTTRHWGDDWDRACDHANGADRAAVLQTPAARLWHSVLCDDGHAYTAPVGAYRANAFGLHDLLGNVSEWTHDCWNGNYQGAPVDGSAWSSGDCSMRAVRGGAWDDGPTGVRAAYRVGSPTTIRLYSRGFRVATDD
jgi:formylglycine-generating enzyme